ncbi:MAG: response regulator [Candidatus Binatia bacterium]
MPEIDRNRSGLADGLHTTSLVLAGATLLLGLAVLFGWHTGNRTLVQLLPQFVPMQYNTALGFVFCGAALLGLGLGRPRWALAAGSLAMLVGSLTLLEYIGHVDLGIDELFMKHDVTIKTSHPGRMAPNTALCFTLVGAAAAFSPTGWSRTSRSVLRVVLVSLAMGLSAVALSGYLARLETAYGWGNLTRMALHTSVGFILVSSGMLCVVWSRDLEADSGLPRWMPAPIAIGILTATLCFWQALSAESARIAIRYEELTSLSLLADVMLVVGVLLSLAMALAAYLAQKSRQRAQEVVRANARLQAHRDNLETLVTSRTEELERARVDAESANRAKSTFLANMSHELRTPLNAIIGYSEMLAEDLEDEGQGEHVPDLNKINASGKHLLALINDVLDLSKIEAGRMDLYLEHFDVAQLLEEALGTTAPLVEKKSNRMVTDIAADLGAMRADATKVRQAIFNLISNAAKFSENGTITLTATRVARGDSEWVVFSVADTGIGIAPDKIELVFEEFAQAEDHTSRDYGGTGLGLPISRRFCRMMGGDVTVESVVGEGSTFTIALPANLEVPDQAEPDPAQSIQEDTDKGSAGTGAHEHPVLVIDDNADSRDVVRRTLEADGHTVVMASAGEEGLILAREISPSLILLDVMMPGLDGWSVLRRLKADSDLRTIPVVMVTVVDDQVRMAVALGAADYLTKPVDRELLLEVTAELAGSGRHALVVEDDAATRELVARTLESSGWTVAAAQNGREGLQRIDQRMPDFVLLDLMMPEMNGFEFMERLRELPAARELPVVVLTAKELDPEEREFLAARTEGVVQKGSAAADELLPLVRRAISEKRKRADLAAR